MRRFPILLSLISLPMFASVLGFSGWLSVASLRKNYSESVIASYAVAGGEAKRKIEYAVRYGKPLDNFFGVRELLAQVKAYGAGIKDVRMVGVDGKVLYSLDDNVVGASLPAAIKRQVAFTAAHLASPHAHQAARDGGLVHVFLPLKGKDGGLIGSMVIVFGEGMIDDGVAGFARDSARNALVIAVASTLALALLLLAVPLLDASGRLRKTRLLIVFACVLGSGQLLYGYQNSSEFKRIQLGIATENAARTASVIGHDIKRVVQLGVPYSKLDGLDDWLNRTMMSVPEIGYIQLTDSTGKTLCATKGIKSEIDSSLIRSIPLSSDRDGVCCDLTVALSEWYLDGRARDVLLDMLTVGLTSFFFMIEIVIAFLVLAGIRASSGAGEGAELGGVAIIRPLAFMFFIATDMSISFIPVHMKSLYEPLLGLGEATVLSLPISVEMLCASLTSISTGFLIDRKGWRLPFYLGAVVIGSGMLLSGLAWSALSFIAARGIVGAGYGFAWMAMRGYVAANRSSAARAMGFSQLNAGIYAGNICACALGAMLAERIGYSGVFFAALAVVCLVAIFAVFCVSDSALAPMAESTTKATPRRLMDFFGDTGIWSLFLLVTIPSALCLTGFLNYFFPLFSHGLGLSPSNIGRAFMVYGICIVYLGPMFGKLLAFNNSFRRAIPFACCIGAAAMLLFSVKGGILMAMVTVLLFGISDSIGFVAQNVYLLNLRATGEFGQGKALGFFSMTKKIGQMLGPIVLAWGVGCGATQQGVGMVAVMYLVCIAAFIGVSIMFRERLRVEG